MVVDSLRLMLFPALIAYAAVSDLMTMTISNRVSLLLIAGFALMAVLTGMPAAAIAAHAGAGALVLAIAFACFALNWIGGGDAKIAAAAALWFGFGHLLDFLLYASLFGGALTLLLLQWRQWPLPYAFINQRWLLRLHDKASGIPYGVALALGALTVYPATEWMKAASLGRLAGL